MNFYAKDHPQLSTHVADLGMAYDPTDLVSLAHAQWPMLPELATALSTCTWAWPMDDGYLSMLDPRTPDQTYAGEIVLQDPARGPLLVHLLRQDAGGQGHFRIAGVEGLFPYAQVDLSDLGEMDDFDDLSDVFDPAPEDHPSTSLRVVR